MRIRSIWARCSPGVTLALLLFVPTAATAQSSVGDTIQSIYDAERSIDSLQEESARTVDALLSERVRASTDALAGRIADSAGAVIRNLPPSPQPGSDAAADTVRRPRTSADVEGELDRSVRGYAAPQGDLSRLQSRSAELRRTLAEQASASVPASESAAYSSLISSLYALLNRDGIESLPLERLHAEISTAVSASADIAAMKQVVDAIGIDVSREPRSDDAPGWRFLLRQAIDTEWVTLLATADRTAMPDRFSELASIVEPISADLAASLRAEGARIARTLDELGTIRRAVLTVASNWNEVDELGALYPAGQRDQISARAQQVTDALASILGAEPHALRYLSGNDALTAALVNRIEALLEVAGPATADRLALAWGLSPWELRTFRGVVAAGLADRRGLKREQAEAAVADRAGAVAGSDWISRSKSRLAAYQAEGESTLAAVERERSAAPPSELSIGLRWALLSVMENRYAAVRASRDPRYSAVRAALAQLLAPAYRRADAAVEQLLRTDTINAQVGASFDAWATGRTISAARSGINSRGVMQIEAVPVEDYRSAYARAFFEASRAESAAPDLSGDRSTPAADQPQGSQTPTAEGYEEWALLHGQSFVPWRTTRPFPLDAGFVPIDDAMRRSYRSEPDIVVVAGATDFRDLVARAMAPWLDAFRNEPVAPDNSVGPAIQADEYLTRGLELFASIVRSSCDHFNATVGVAAGRLFSVRLEMALATIDAMFGASLDVSSGIAALEGLFGIDSGDPKTRSDSDRVDVLVAALLDESDRARRSIGDRLAIARASALLSARARLNAASQSPETATNGVGADPDPAELGRMTRSLLAAAEGPAARGVISQADYRALRAAALAQALVPADRSGAFTAAAAGSAALLLASNDISLDEYRAVASALRPGVTR